MGLADDVFDTLLNPDTKARLRSEKAVQQRKELEARGMTDAELQERVSRVLLNLTCRCREGVLTYEGVLVNVLVPELMRRLSDAD